MLERLLGSTLRFVQRHRRDASLYHVQLGIEDDKATLSVAGPPGTSKVNVGRGVSAIQLNGEGLTRVQIDGIVVLTGIRCELRKGKRVVVNLVLTQSGIVRAEVMLPRGARHHLCNDQHGVEMPSAVLTSKQAVGIAGTFMTDEQARKRVGRLGELATRRRFLAWARAEGLQHVPEGFEVVPKPAPTPPPESQPQATDDAESAADQQPDAEGAPQGAN